MTTIDLIDVFCRQSIIGIDPIDVFFTIGAQLCKFHMTTTSHDFTHGQAELRPAVHQSPWLDTLTIYCHSLGMTSPSAGIADTILLY
jgi:hypothetical protein